MKEWLKWSGVVLLAAIVGLAFAVVIATSGLVQPFVITTQATTIPTTPYPRSWGHGPGWMGPGLALSGAEGMMGGYGHMGGYGGWAYSGGTPLTLDQAVEAANQYLAAYGNPDPSTALRQAQDGGSGQVLALTEVMEFSENFYAEVEERSSGVHAFELLIDRYTGSVYPEPGPNMMWNTKYGHMGRMMASWWGQAPDTISVTPEQARDLAQKWLDGYLPGTSAAEQADAFYGYYTIHVVKDGQVFGMLSVNGYTGEVRYHTWHGNFIDMKELED
ncbi:MAG: hypothetical protein AB1345_06055 [Chloroflexota bacterium]